MKKSLVTSLVFLTYYAGLCQISFTSYSSLSLPENLKKDANAVYRLDEGVLDVISPSKYIFKTHQVITLLNNEAARHLQHVLHYDKFEKVENVEVKIYNAAGELVKKYQKKNFETRNYFDGFSLYTDDKLLYLETSVPAYPCTIEVTTQKTVNGYLMLPAWIVATPYEAVEYSSFTVNVPSGLEIKHRELNLDLKPEIKTSGDIKSYTWIIRNIPASKYETNSYSSNNLPRIDIVPENFEYDGHKGEFKSWQSFGDWNYPLYEDNNSFTQQDMRKINALVYTCKTDREKIKVLYDYLKQNMRYVSIQLGIGGFKPFPVSYVNEKKYGDCKALTNYMRYLLKAVGIKSYPALINAGYNRMPADINFPSDPFNHVILCVPLDRDSVWLECTSNNNESGFLGSFTEDKNALLLTENGGVLVSTPKSNYSNSILRSKTIISLNEDGGSSVNGNVFCTGDFWNLFYEIMQEDKNTKKDIFIDYLHYKIPEKFQISEGSDFAGEKQFNLTLSYDQQYDFKTGSKMFFKPRLSSLSNEDIKPMLQRKYDYVFRFPYTKIDTTIYKLPTGYTVDKLPAKKHLENDYGFYENEYLKNENGSSITIVGKLILKKKIIPPADYLKVAEFFQEVNRSENEKFIVIKN